ncbi:MAG TPA: MBL fold metallo-hydrolase [Candidatus Paceibacterota bacterium]
MAKLTFHGGAQSVTGANYLLESGGAKILVDCGLAQGSKFAEDQNFEDFPYNPAEIDSLLITHAHIDHTGRIPYLYKKGFRGHVYSTPPTKDFAEQLLIDSEDILRREAEEAGREPLYDIRDVREILKKWETVNYRQPARLGDFAAEFFDAGHILGSAFISVTTPEGKRVIFSGDLGNMPNPLLKDTEPIGKADYVLVESTYGGRTHEPAQKRTKLFEQVIRQTAKNKAVLMIPAFAMERTQQLLYEINNFMESNPPAGGPRIPVYIDSPLAIKITAIYKKYAQDTEYFDAKAIAQIRNGDAIFDFPGLRLTLTSRQSKEINDAPPPKIIIAGSGMSQGGRILHHEKRYLQDPNSTILFVGYQAKGSLGRQILEGAKEVSIFDEQVPVRCNVQAIGGYSAHADQPKLIEWLQTAQDKPETIFVVQGEEEQATALADKIKTGLSAKALVPLPSQTVTL